MGLNLINIFFISEVKVIKSWNHDIIHTKFLYVFRDASWDIPFAFLCIPIFNIFIDWRSSYNMPKVLTICFLDRKTMWGAPQLKIAKRLVKHTDPFLEIAALLIIMFLGVECSESCPSFCNHFVYLGPEKHFAKSLELLHRIWQWCCLFLFRKIALTLGIT